MIPVFHMQITERCPSVVLPADTRDLAWPLLHAISSVQQLREVSTDTLDAKPPPIEAGALSGIVRFTF